ncbi:hypothetical protein MBLNU230_g2662t1 [Neophaeotheca triangularis]
MPTASSTVIYPQGATFNMDYYLSTHMPLVMSKWGPHGLKSWRVLKFGDDQAYCVQASLEWASVEDMQKAVQSEATAEVMGDVKNFSDKEPVFLGGAVVGSS